MNKSRVLPVMALAVLIGVSTACTDMTPQQQGTMTGVAIGAVTGAGIIALAGGSAWTGAAVGAVAGGIAGNIKGSREQQAQ
jgi:osmotically inducible lipoprotein OsmB